MTRFTSSQEMSKTNPAKTTRPIHRLRSPAGSRAIPTGPTYCSRPGVIVGSLLSRRLATQTATAVRVDRRASRRSSSVLPPQIPAS